MSTIAALLREIGTFCKDFGITESTFGRRAMSDGKFVERIKAGGGLTVANLDRLRAYMAEERAAARRAPARKRAA